MLRFIHEYFTLLGRNFRILMADWVGLSLATVLAPLIFLVLWIAFFHISNDTQETDNQVLYAQLFFDTMNIYEEKLPANDKPISLPTYNRAKSTDSLSDFKDDFYLYNCLFPKVANRGTKSREYYDSKAQEIWEGSEIDGLGDSKFLPCFSLFRYNLAFMNNNTSIDWPSLEPERLAKLIEECTEILIKRSDALKTIRSYICGEESTRSHITVFFIIIATSIWMGLLPACKEIVSEWDIFLWESRNKVSSSAFLASKFTLLLIVTALQNALLIYLTAQVWQEFPIIHTLAFYIILVLTSACAVAFGLFISCIVPTLRAGLMIIPMIMIAQIILGGLLRLPAKTKDDNMKHIRGFASKATIQYWAFEAMVGSIARLSEKEAPFESADFLHRDIITIKKPEKELHADRETLNAFLKSKTIRVDSYVFDDGEPFEWLLCAKDMLGLCDDENDWKLFIYHVIRPLLFLLLATFSILFITLLLLKIKLAIIHNGGLIAMFLRL